MYIMLLTGPKKDYSLQKLWHQSYVHGSAIQCILNEGFFQESSKVRAVGFPQFYKWACLGN